VSLVRAQVREPYFKRPALDAGFLFYFSTYCIIYTEHHHQTTQYSRFMMSLFTVRLAHLTDLSAIATLFDQYRQFYGRASDLQAASTFLQERFQHQDSVLLLAEHAGQAVGFVQLYPSFSSGSLARTFILNDLYVQPHVRQQGCGQTLLCAAQTWAKSQQAIRLTLSTAIDNTAAQALYQRLGWQKDQQFWVYHYVL
jgi:ribosomal protein S18 acetylase RimI-like enzyme